MAKPPSQQAGFTITELMIVIAVVGVLAALAAPNMGAMIRTQRIKTAAFDVFSSLTFARSEAIKRNTSVIVTPVDAGNWARGWSIADSNGNMLRQQSGWDAITATGPATVTFASSGRVTPAADFSLAATGVSSQRCVRLDLSGRASTKEGAC